MSTDDIYTTTDAESGSFEFSESVAEVFPDMLKRSIPGYGASIQAIGTLASRYVQPGTRCFDLGCSLGAATVAMQRNIAHPGCKIIAVDTAPAMVDKCQDLVAIEKGPAQVSVIQTDVREVDISNASMIVMNYTLQFLPVAERQSMMNRIYKGMLPGGILVLSEKVVDEDAETEELLVHLHQEFKRRNAYSDLEISRKRTALENVLVPDTESEHLRRLDEAGFEHAGVWLRYFNFLSIVAIRQRD